MNAGRRGICSIAEIILISWPRIVSSATGALEVDVIRAALRAVPFTFGSGWVGSVTRLATKGGQAQYHRIDNNFPAVRHFKSISLIRKRPSIPNCRPRSLAACEPAPQRSGAPPRWARVGKATVAARCPAFAQRRPLARWPGRVATWGPRRAVSRMLAQSCRRYRKSRNNGLYTAFGRRWRVC
jgi:hypothetical protein